MTRFRGAARSGTAALVVLVTVGILITSCASNEDAGDAFARKVDNPAPGDMVTFADVTGYTVSTVTYGPDPEHLADVYVPGPAERVHGDRTPLVVYVHGGGWVFGSRRNPVPGSIIALTMKGWAVASVDYRLANASHRAPAQEQDVARAIVWFKDNARSLGLDPSMIVLAGHSAGGHLAALVGTACARNQEVFQCAPELDEFTPAVGATGSSPEVQGIITFGAIYDVAGWGRSSLPATVAVSTLTGCAPSAQCDETLLASQEPLTHLDPTDPPVYVYHAVDDVVVAYDSQAVVAIRALERTFANRSSRMVWFDSGESGGHDPDGSNAGGIARFVEAVRTGGI